MILQNTSTNDSTVNFYDDITSLENDDKGEALKRKLLQPEILATNSVQNTTSSKLSCRILGFYPFPSPPPKGPLGWLFKDTHQAIMVTSTSYYFKNDGAKKVRKTAVLLDFMTKGGASHPVWYD